jgi:hypothetical protein
LRVPFRAKLVLLAVNEYAYGDHVSDQLAFRLRCRAVLRNNYGVRLTRPPPALKLATSAGMSLLPARS